MNLSAVFSAVAHKKLVIVDLPNQSSNQHELNGTASLREVFGTSTISRGRLKWRYFADDQPPESDEAEFTFYDARAKSSDRTGRSEWRFYYYGNFLSRAQVGDWLVIAITPSGETFGLLFQKDSAWHRAGAILFGVSDSTDLFSAIPRESLNSQELELLQRQILLELDLEVSLPSIPSDEEMMLKRFGRSFPTTKEMSDFARSNVDVDIRNSDQTLVRWLEREEQLFRALESVIINERIGSGFESVDDFISYSLSVQNRRKSRMGYALQNHLAELFNRNHLRYSAQARTEGNNQPDFIFPGSKEYHTPTFNASLLVMLAAKSTSKDRWRQVLTEADRIPAKHLCTLEAGISVRQTGEMKRHLLALVIPRTLHTTYTAEQRQDILTVEQFIVHVRRLQT